MKDVMALTDTPPAAATPQEREASAIRVLQMIGARGMALDAIGLEARLRVIGQVLIEAGLVAEDRVAELVAQARADYAEELVREHSSAKRKTTAPLVSG